MLATDIENAGGLRNFDKGKTQGLSELLDYRSIVLKEPEYYGIRGDTQRRKISQKVRTWKSLDQQTYLKKLKNLEVVPAAATAKGIVSNDSALTKRFESLVVDSHRGSHSGSRSPDSDLSDSDHHSKPRPRKRSNRGEANPLSNPAPRDLSRDLPPRDLPPRDLPRSIAPRDIPTVVTAMSSPRNRVVEIDPQYPGDLGEGIFAFRISDVEYGHFEWKGCMEIELLVDERDVQANLYSIEYKEGTNIAILTKPILPAPFVHDKAEFEARQLLRYIQKGHDAARSAYAKLSREDQVRKITLKFQDHVCLCEVPFRATGVAHNNSGGIEIASPQMIAYRKATGRTDQAGDQILGLYHRLTWKFADSSKAVALATAGNLGVRAADDAYAGL